MSESQNIEYKESWRTEYLKWICGFANAHGGTIYIGIDDTGKVVGVKDIKKLMDDIPNQIQSGLGIITSAMAGSIILCSRGACLARGKSTRPFGFKFL